jgi:Uma2 family endonuclease
MTPEPGHLYTFSEYLTIEGDDRWELIEGRLQIMSAPSLLHQAVSMGLSVALWPFFSGKPCRLLAAPVAVKLSERNAVQPDLLVNCRPEIMKKNYIDGAPELVIEILSPSTQRHDRLTKLNLYARLGVKEYWLVTTRPFLIEVLRHRGELFEVAGVFGENDKLQSSFFPELTLDLASLHAALPPADELAEPEPSYY